MISTQPFKSIVFSIVLFETIWKLQDGVKNHLEIPLQVQVDFKMTQLEISK
jgi:hypothetical protein